MSMDPAEHMLCHADFIDPGADDDEPVKGIKQGHLRTWFEQEQDIEERLRDETITVSRVWDALKITTFEEAGGLAIFEIVARQRAALEKVHHTLSVHGHIDAYTDLHATVQTALYPTASMRAGCNHWPGQTRCGVCGMDNAALPSSKGKV